MARSCPHARPGVFATLRSGNANVAILWPFHWTDPFLHLQRLPHLTKTYISAHFATTLLLRLQEMTRLSLLHDFVSEDVI